VDADESADRGSTAEVFEPWRGGASVLKIVVRATEYRMDASNLDRWFRSSSFDVLAFPRFAEEWRPCA
jgi:hypothetical protein